MEKWFSPTSSRHADALSEPRRAKSRARLRKTAPNQTVLIAATLLKFRHLLLGSDLIKIALLGDQRRRPTMVS